MDETTMPRFESAPARSSLPDWYPDLLDRVSAHISVGHRRAVTAANKELLASYWSIGREILGRQHEEGWGSRVIDRLSTDLKTRFPGATAIRHETLSTCVRLRPHGRTRQLCNAPLHNCPRATTSRCSTNPTMPSSGSGTPRLRSQMTNHYARLHDKTVRNAWAKARKINAHGHEVVLDDDHPLSDAQWARTGLARAKQTLPNGYCGMPIQSDCEHANPCLTCPLSITTPAFLPQHETQLRTTLTLIDKSDAAGHARVAEKNRQIAGNLTKIISACKACAQ